MKRSPQHSASPTNADIAEWLAREADTASYPLSRAMRKASRSAFLWPQEAADLVGRGSSLTELAGVGPYLEKLIRQWVSERKPSADRTDLRKDFFTWAQAQTLIAKHPALRERLRGDLQMHTEWSDGSGTVRSMAEAAIEKQYEYIAITDHAKKLKIAGGMDEAELALQGEEIRQTNRSLAEEGKSLTLLRSIELNLDKQGQGDMEAAALEQLDIVIGAFHSSLRTTEDQTARYLSALENPKVHVLAHPCGRVFNYRIGLQADWPRVFERAAELGKAVEIDCYPDRQDLNVALVKLARESGAKISLGTDAHHPWQLQFIDFGLATLIAAKFPPERVLNFMRLEELLRWVNSLTTRKAKNAKRPRQVVNAKRGTRPSPGANSYFKRAHL